MSPRSVTTERPLQPWTPPCPPPADGWPPGPRDANLDYDLDNLKDTGAAVEVVLFRPSATQVVLVVAAADPAAVEARLRPQLAERLCVVASRFSRPEIDAVREDLVRLPGEWRIWAVSGACDDQGQPLITVELSLVQPEFAAWVSEQPEGLVQVDAWLTPRRGDPVVR